MLVTAPSVVEVCSRFAKDSATAMISCRQFRKELSTASSGMCVMAIHYTICSSSCVVMVIVIMLCIYIHIYAHLYRVRQIHRVCKDCVCCFCGVSERGGSSS